METCPHGKRIVIDDAAPVRFVDECVDCTVWVADLGFSSLVLPRESPEQHNARAHTAA